MKHSLILLMVAQQFLINGAAFAQSNPTPLVPDIEIEYVINVPAYCSRIALDPISKDLYYTVLSGEVHRVTITGPILSDTLLFDNADHHIQFLQGIVFYDSTLYLIGDVIPDLVQTRGLIMRGKLQSNGERLWDTVAITSLYPSGNTAFDHGFSGITINLSGDSLFINSGSRTDHGEEQNNGGLFPGAREVPLTSAIFRIPSNAQNLLLENDSAALAPYLYADGVRNSFDLAFAPNGELFGEENSGDRDDPDELNWIRKGKHYGFPWILGGDYNPQQFPGYNPETDMMLSKNRYAYKKGFYHNDSLFPPIPAGLIITEGIQNLGPDADYYRDSSTGTVLKASISGYELRSLTPHRAPVGLVFDMDSLFASPYHGSAFMLGYQNQADSNGVAPDSTNGTLLDPSEDLVHLDLSYDVNENNYKTSATRIVQGFTHPVDACIDSTAIYVIEYSMADAASIWKITFPGIDLNAAAELLTNQLSVTICPNPSQGNVSVLFSLSHSCNVNAKLFNMIGNKIMDLGTFRGSKGPNRFTFSPERLDEGYYLIQLESEVGIAVCKLLLAK